MIPINNDERKAGRGKLEVADCVTEDDAKKRINDFFAPPDPFGPAPRMKPAMQYLRTPESEASSDEEDEYSIRRRCSQDTSTSGHILMAPYLSPAPSPTLSTTSQKQATLPRTPDIPHITKPRALSHGEFDITKQLEGLLVTPEEDHNPRFHLSTSARAQFEKQANERKVQKRAAAIRATRERRLVRRYPAQRLVNDLSKYWDESVTNAAYERNQQRVLAKAIRGTELHNKDFQTLLWPRAWLNDEIINAYLEWIEDAANKAANAEAKEAGERPSDVPKFIAHNSFFYSTIVDPQKGPKQTERLMKRKKAPGKSFMQVDSMFVPINKGAHWTVAVIRPVAKTIEYFDSMGGSGHQVIDHMRKWLQFQFGSAYVEAEWTVPRTRCAVQNNGYDCGVFVCTNSLCVALGLDTFCYTESDMTQQRKNIAAILINRGFVGDFTWNAIGM